VVGPESRARDRVEPAQQRLPRQANLQPRSPAGPGDESGDRPLKVSAEVDAQPTRPRGLFATVHPERQAVRQHRAANEFGRLVVDFAHRANIGPPVRVGRQVHYASKTTLGAVEIIQESRNR
jgi:hypothetical protein